MLETPRLCCARCMLPFSTDFYFYLGGRFIHGLSLSFSHTCFRLDSCCRPPSIFYRRSSLSRANTRVTLVFSSLSLLAHAQRLEAFQESLQISSSIFSAVRRCPGLARDRAILPTVLQGCCSENSLAARHSFAVLAEQAAESPAIVSQVGSRK